MKLPLFLSFLLCLALSGTVAGAQPLQVDGGRLGSVREYMPPKDHAIDGVVAMISDRSGWDDAADRLAQHIAENGRVVLGIDLATYLKVLTQDKGDCSSVNVDFEVILRTIEKGLPFRQYHPGVILGVGAAGAGVAYAVVGEALPTTFAGGIGIGFTPAFDIGRKLCLPVEAGAQGAPVRYAPVTNRETAWLFTPAPDFATPNGGMAAFLSAMHEAHVIDNATDSVAAVDDALGQIPRLNAYRSSVSGLPTVEVPPRDDGQPTHPLVVFYSGDGGWRDIDKQIGGYMADQGFFVLGFDSLRYFWRERQPAEMAADLDKVIRHYADRFKGKGVILVGYSFGADVLPFIVNRMSRDTRSLVRLISLLGVSQHASFEIRLEGILGAANTDGPPTLPELLKVKDTPMQCIYGFDETDSVCASPSLDKIVQRVEMKGGHHFDGDYHDAADDIIAAARAKVGM